MKKIIIKSSLTFILLFLVSAALMAGKPFEGVITYKISYPDNKFSEAQLNMFPKMMTISMKGSKARTEMNTGAWDTNRDRGLCMTKTKVALIDMMGQKYAIKQTAEDIGKENADTTERNS